MFCKIRKGKNTYSIYACDRKRINGKVVSKDIKVCSFAWHSLYEDDEEVSGLIEDIPVGLMRIITKVYLKNKNIELDFDEVVEKLIKVKKEYYPTYRIQMIDIRHRYEVDRQIREDKELSEYENFKNKYRSLHYKELMEKYKEGYDRGLLEGVLNNFNQSSVRNNDLSKEEMKLLKEGFKLLAMKYHPDKGGDSEKMSMINNLKERIMK